MELPKFRRLEDVQRFLEVMHKEINTSGKLVIHQQQLLAKLAMPTPKLRAMLSAAVEFDITPSAGKSSMKDFKKKIDPALQKVVIPNLTKLKDQYGLLEDLYQKHTTLDSVATQVAMQFPDRRGELYDKTIGAINELKSKVEGQLRTVFDFLANIAQKHVPEAFQEYVTALATRISDHVYFEDSQRFLYVSVKEGDLKADPSVGKIGKEQCIVFTEYIMLTDSVSDDGKIAPQLYVVVQWIVGGAVYIYVEHEFTPPNQLSEGMEVATVAEASAAVAHLLEIEGFASYLGTVPLSLQLRITPDQLKPSMFEGRNYIDKIIVDQDKMSFIFKHHLTSPETKKRIAVLIFPQVKAMLRTKSAKLRVSITKDALVFYIANVAEEGQVSIHDLAFLKDRFGLSDVAVDSIGRVINKGKGKTQSLREQKLQQGV